MGTVSVRHKQGSVRVELHRGVVVGVGRRTPVLHQPNPVFLGVDERPVATRAVVVDYNVDLQPFQNGVLLAEGETIDDALALASPVVVHVYVFVCDGENPSPS